MKFPTAMMHDSVWTDRLAYVNAEEHYQLHLVGHLPGSTSGNENRTSAPVQSTNAPQGQNAQCNASPLITEISTIRENIKSTLSGVSSVDNPRFAKLEEENMNMMKMLNDLSAQIGQLTTRVETLEREASSSLTPSTKKEAALLKKDDDDDDFELFGEEEAVAPKKADSEEEDDFDLFADDDDEEETEEEKKKKEEILQKYHEKKAKKTAVVAKSSIVLFVKPWDDETDMAEMERLVRTVAMDGLLWGDAKLVPVGYGINKLQIACVVEDDKVGSEILIEEITAFGDHVQSVDVASFNKI